MVGFLAWLPLILSLLFFHFYIIRIQFKDLLNIIMDLNRNRHRKFANIFFAIDNWQRERKGDNRLFIALIPKVLYSTFGDFSEF